MDPIEALGTALRYPWNDGDAGVTLVVGGVLTLLSPLVLPGIAVLGYGIQVAKSVLVGDHAPPGFGDWRSIFGDGLRGLVVLVGWVVVPMLIGTVALVMIAGTLGVRFRGPVPVLSGAGGFGGVVFVLLIVLAGLALVLAYLTPAALVLLATRSQLGDAFAVSDVRSLAAADEYGSAWLLALVVFAAASVVLAVLNVAAIGVIVSGFVTFYAFVAMTFLYADGASGAGMDLPEASDQPAEA